MKQNFVVLMLVLLCFSGALTIKCLSMNNNPYIVRSTLFNLNPDHVMGVAILLKIHLVEYVFLIK